MKNKQLVNIIQTDVISLFAFIHSFEKRLFWSENNYLEENKLN